MKTSKVLSALLGVAAQTLASPAPAADAVNLTEAVRTAHAAGECGEPTITGVGHASYPYSNAFDGITSSNALTRYEAQRLKCSNRPHD